MRHEGPTMTAREAAQNLVTELGKVVLRWGQPVTTTTYHPFDEAR